MRWGCSTRRRCLKILWCSVVCIVWNEKVLVDLYNLCMISRLQNLVLLAGCWKNLSEEIMEWREHQEKVYLHGFFVFWIVVLKECICSSMSPFVLGMLSLFSQMYSELHVKMISLKFFWLIQTVIPFFVIKQRCSRKGFRIESNELSVSLLAKENAFDWQRHLLCFC